MKRRSFLGLAALSLASPWSLLKAKAAIPNYDNLYGWIPNDGTNDPSVYKLGDLEGYGQDKTTCLWKTFEKVMGHPWYPRSQAGPDCVAKSAAGVIDILTCCHIIWKNKSYIYYKDSSSDMIYSGCRNIIGIEELGYKPSAGAFGTWAAEYLKRYGNLFMIKYGKYDLSKYSANTLKYWDTNGVPKELLITAKEHPVITTAPVTCWEEARDSVSAGKPVLFTGLLGFEDDRRDKEGFCKPKGEWPHAWILAGCQDGKRPGACLLNNWGKNFGSGPKALDQPDGSIWVDAEHIDGQLRKFGDSYAFSNYKGFSKPEKEYILW